MNVRKVRTHQTGVSNLIARNDVQTAAARSPQIYSPEMPHSKKFTDALIKRGKQEFSPQKKGEDFYKTTGKNFRAKTETGYPRSANLEEIDKRKIVFTGESHLLYDKDLEKYRDLESADYIVPHPMLNKQHLIQDKRDINGTAIQETQLVGYDKYNADTLKNNVNLEKVREAKRILRRRYANRNQLQKIYAAWDEKNQGYINTENVYSMSKKLGLNLNVDEARVLLASANRSGSGKLSLDEFLDLIYNKEDVLNVDLDKLSNNLDEHYLVKREELYNNDDGILKKLESDAKRTRQNRHMNQVNLVLKNKFNAISTGLYSADLNKAGYVNFEKFEESIKRLGINDTMVSQDDINLIFDKYKSADQHTINYRSFLEDLKKFNFHFDEAYAGHNDDDSPKRNVAAVDIDPSAAEHLNIVDCRTLPFNTLEDYLGRTRKVSKAIKRYFPTPDSFQNYLSESINVPKEQLDTRVVSQEDAKSIINGLFSQFDNSILKKKDFQGFLSTILYNKQGETNLKELCNLIYSDTDRAHYEKISYRQNGPPPGFSNTEAQEFMRMTAGSPVKTAGDTRLTTSFQGFKVNPEDPELDREMRKIVQKFDDKVFMDRKGHKETYRSFDLDKDGFVSRGEFMKKVEDMCIMNNNELVKLVGYLDPENKGYVNFKEFSGKIKANMAQQTDEGEYTILPNITSSKKWVQKMTLDSGDARSKIGMITKGFSSSSPIYSPTRYGASPNWSNTFSNFQPANNSGMYSPEGQRFNRSHDHRIEFQKEAQFKKTMRDIVKFEKINNNQETLKSRIDDINIKSENLVKSNMNKIAEERSQYEKKAKLRNKYAF